MAYLSNCPTKSGIVASVTMNLDILWFVDKYLFACLLVILIGVICTPNDYTVPERDFFITKVPKILQHTEAVYYSDIIASK